MFLISCCGLMNPPGEVSKCQRKFIAWEVAWGPPEAGDPLLCWGAGWGQWEEAAPGRVWDPGLCSVSCFSSHFSDGFINICCSFLSGHVLAPREAGSSGHFTERQPEAQSHEGSLGRGRDYNGDLQTPKVFPLLRIKRMQGKPRYFWA